MSNVNHLLSSDHHVTDWSPSDASERQHGMECPMSTIYCQVTDIVLPSRHSYVNHFVTATLSSVQPDVCLLQLLLATLQHYFPMEHVAFSYYYLGIYSRETNHMKSVCVNL